MSNSEGLFWLVLIMVVLWLIFSGNGQRAVMVLFPSLAPQQSIIEPPPLDGVA